jgi:hypothetical protein
MARVRLLLVNPRYPESFWSFRWAVDSILPGKRAINPPLGLATLAALCPPDWEVEIVDENVSPLPLAPEADLIGICGMGVQFRRQRALLAHYRRRGYRTVAGGSYASLCPDEYAARARPNTSGPSSAATSRRGARSRSTARPASWTSPTRRCRASISSPSTATPPPRSSSRAAARTAASFATSS